MELILVNDEQTARQFLEVHVRINKDVPGWIRPLDKDINEVFDPSKNKMFRFGECKRWLLKDGQGKLIGRIAAFTNKKYRNKGDAQPTGAMGFFDCINDQAAANLLLDTARDWLAEKGMKAMDGPINFGERDRWWGLLIEGFHEPLYGMNFNPPYYKALLEHYGFQLFYEQICFSLKVKDKVQKKFYTRHQAIANDPDYHSEHIRKNKLEKYAGDFAEIYNKAWAKHEGGKEIAREQAVTLFKKMKMVMDPRAVWFVYYKDQPIACWLNLPDLNQYFKHLNGKFGWWQKIKFLFLKLTGSCHKLVGILFGIVPEFQGKGVDAYMVMEGAKLIQGKHLYDEYELQWIGDFNPRMINIAGSLGTHRSRKLATYRYLFDREQPFSRHPILG